jgi:acetylornithine deacetylase/succinyl-diaminopimelate desuccinylase-like protein
MMKMFWVFLMASVAFGAEPAWESVEGHALELLRSYIQIPSVNPPANVAAAAALIKAEFEKNGFQPVLYKSGPDGQTNLVVRLKGRDSSKKPLLLLNHFDVVPVDAKAWDVDPFGAVIKQGFIYGRGALDMKGLGVQQMTALIELKKAGIVPARDIVMLCTADEESSGEKGIQWMIANHPEVVDAEYVLDEGGLGSRDALAPGKLAFGISVGDKVILWLRLRAKGTAGHGSQPIADNANMILLNAIGKAVALPEGGKTNPVVEEMKARLGAFAENKYTSAIQRNTISLTSLQSGVKVNVIPSAAEATLDCRLLPGTNSEEFLSDIKARINDPRVTVEVITTAPDPGMSRVDTPLYAAMARAITQAHAGAVVTPMLVPFGTDSVYLQRRGVVAYGFMPMVLDAATAATMHSDRERIPVAEFLKGLHIYFEVLRSEW